jgi:hypothetical protein
VDFPSVASVTCLFDVRNECGVWNWMNKNNEIQPLIPRKQPQFHYLHRAAARNLIMTLYPWEGSEFLPFYKNQDIISIKQLTDYQYPKTAYPAKLLATLYYNRAKKTGVLYVSNCYTPYQKYCRVTIDFAKLGLPYNTRIILPLEGGEPVPIYNSAIELTLGGNDFEMLVIGDSDWDGKLKPWMEKCGK